MMKKKRKDDHIISTFRCQSVALNFRMVKDVQLCPTIFNLNDIIIFDY